ncbi:hypothetical protein Ple7327_3070 [Pleurocapsa sp. PCC 7327]|nr:hypothetical protein Ple7327_3070 [Pleurocapsa sp. PCC 7327]
MRLESAGAIAKALNFQEEIVLKDTESNPENNQKFENFDAQSKQPKNEILSYLDVML